MNWLPARGTAADFVLSLRERRELLAECLVPLLADAWARGYTVILGEVVRDPRIAQLNGAAGTGIKRSVHTEGLAVDVNLFRDGRFLASGAEHTPLGEAWETRHPLCRWGGRFGDPNHYSIFWQGRR